MKLTKPRFPERYFFIALVVATTIPIVIFPDRYLPSVSYGLNLFVLNVFPALFPFFFFSTILSGLNFGYDLGLAMKKPLKKLYNAPPVAGYVFVMSLLCGYPIGAKLLSDFYSDGLVTKEEAKSVASFTSTSGPLFIVGTVGVTMLGDKKAGFIILISHYIATLINGLIFRRKKSTEEKSTLAPPVIDADGVLKKSMVSALLSVAVVGGFIAVFNLVLNICADVKIIEYLTFPLMKCGVDKSLSEGIISAFIEITKGCLIVSKSGFPIKITAPVCALLITNGGLSVTMQSLTFLGKCKISPAYYLFFKATQGILAFFICFLLSLLLL